MNQTVAEPAAVPHYRSSNLRNRRHGNNNNASSSFDIEIRVAVNVSSGGGGGGSASVDHFRSTFSTPTRSSPTAPQSTHHRSRQPPFGRHGPQPNRMLSWPSSATTTAAANATLTAATSTAMLGTYSPSSTGQPPSGLPPMAVHFAVVGALFLAVVILALINAYLHFRAQRRRLARRRRYVATVDERFASRRRSRRQGGGGSGAAAEEDMQAAGAGPRRNTRMTVRMKPTKMFV